MPRLYSGVPLASPRDGAKEKAEQLHDKFAHRLRQALSGATTYRYDEALQKLETLNHIEGATSLFRDIFALTGHTQLKNDTRREFVSLIEALRACDHSSLRRYLPEFERTNFQAETMLLSALINDLASGDLQTHQQAARLTILEDIELTCLNPEHGNLAREVIKKALRQNPELQAEGARNAPARKRRRLENQDQNQRALQAPQKKELQPRLNQPTRGAFIAPSPNRALAEPSPVNNKAEISAFAKRIEENSHYLHSRYSLLTAEAQHGLLRDITELVCEFALNADAQKRAGESDAVAREIRKLIDGSVGFLRRLDKPSRENMKQALSILSKSSNTALVKVAHEGLTDMTPYYVLKDFPEDKLASLLPKLASNTFIVTSAPFPAEEFCVYLSTSSKVRKIKVAETKAANGAILYSLDGLHHYSNLATLIHKELQSSRGFVLAKMPMVPRPPAPDPVPAPAPAPIPAPAPAPIRAPAPAPVPAQAQAPAPTKEVRIQRGIKFGKKNVASLRISHLRSQNGNEYIISNTQAQGGFGKFRYAVDTKGNRWAVKEFRSEFARHKRRAKTNITNFDEIKEEIQLMKKLDATCQVVDAINISGKVYAIMPIMSGEVEDVVKKVPHSNKKVIARNILRQMTTELAKCHQRGFIHRDVKLANALWNPDGQVALSDFGLAVPCPKPPAMLYNVAGTPPFMAPEMFGSKGYDHKIDTWSLALAVAGIHIDWWESPFLPPRHGDRTSWALANFEKYRSIKYFFLFTLVHFGLLD